MMEYAFGIFIIVIMIVVAFVRAARWINDTAPDQNSTAVGPLCTYCNETSTHYASGTAGGRGIKRPVCGDHSLQLMESGYAIEPFSQTEKV